MGEQRSLRDAAVAYAEEGWAVFPLHSVEDGKCSCGNPECSNPGKHPRTQHGLKDASVDTKQIDAWWHTWPDANIGVATGEVSGLVVVDIDSEEAVGAVVDLVGGYLESLPTVETSQGRRQVYFRYPGAPVRNSVSRIAPCVDVRGDGGYVVAPPSKHVSGSTYVWSPRAPIPEMPPQLLEAVSRADAIPELVTLDMELIPQGTRNSTLTSLAGTMRNRGFTSEAIEAALVAENAVRCEPPLDETEVRQISRSVSRYPCARADSTGSRVTQIRIISAEDLYSETEEEPDWVVEGYIARGVITELVSPVKFGKTTLVFAAAQAMADSKDFLGKATKSLPIVFMTEERPSTVRQVMDRVGLTSLENIYVVLRQDTFGMDWPDVVRQVEEQMKEKGPCLYVVDTLGDWAMFRGDEENASGAALQAMKPLQELAAHGNAVLCLRHARKNGGGVGASGRGSSALSGAADILVSMGAVSGHGCENCRVLEGVGRLNGIPSRLNIEFDGMKYAALGEGRAVRRNATKEAITDLLATAEDGGMFEAEIIGETGYDRTTVRNAISELMEEGLIERIMRKTQSNKKAFWHYIVGDEESL